MYWNNSTIMQNSATKRPVGRPRLRDAFRKDKQIKFLASPTYAKKLDAMAKVTGKSKGEIMRGLLAEAKY